MTLSEDLRSILYQMQRLIMILMLIVVTKQTTQYNAGKKRAHSVCRGLINNTVKTNTIELKLEIKMYCFKEFNFRIVFAVQPSAAERV